MRQGKVAANVAVTANAMIMPDSTTPDATFSAAITKKSSTARGNRIILSSRCSTNSAFLTVEDDIRGARRTFLRPEPRIGRGDDLKAPERRPPLLLKPASPPPPPTPVSSRRRGKDAGRDPSDPVERKLLSSLRAQARREKGARARLEAKRTARRTHGAAVRAPSSKATEWSPVLAKRSSRSGAISANSAAAEEEAMERKASEARTRVEARKAAARTSRESSRRRAAARRSKTPSSHHRRRADDAKASLHANAAWRRRQDGSRHHVSRTSNAGIGIDVAASLERIERLSKKVKAERQWLAARVEEGVQEAADAEWRSEEAADAFIRRSWARAVADTPELDEAMANAPSVRKQRPLFGLHHELTHGEAIEGGLSALIEHHHHGEEVDEYDVEAEAEEEDEDDYESRLQMGSFDADAVLREFAADDALGQVAAAGDAKPYSFGTTSAAEEVVPGAAEEAESKNVTAHPDVEDLHPTSLISLEDLLNDSMHGFLSGTTFES